MRRTKQIFAAIFVVLGVLLVVKGFWPISVQLIAGVALIVFGVLRWRTL
jgi:hypothetical protein